MTEVPKKKRSKLRVLSKLVVGGALGSLLALALGTRKGREKTQEVYESVVEKLGSREKIDDIVPLKKKKKN